MRQPVSRSARIEARIAPDALAAVRRAAEIEGRSVSDFVVAAAHAQALRAIEQAQIVQLSLADQERFARALQHPSRPNSGLKRAAAAYRKLVAFSS